MKDDFINIGLGVAAMASGAAAWITVAVLGVKFLGIPAEDGMIFPALVVIFVGMAWVLGNAIRFEIERRRDDS